MERTMNCDSIQKGAFPFQIIRTLKNQDNEAPDVSGASAIAFNAKTPSGELKTFTGAFVTDGTDGKVVFTTSSADDLDEVGTWSGQFVLTISGGTLPSAIFTFKVSNNVGA